MKRILLAATMLLSIGTFGRQQITRYRLQVKVLLQGPYDSTTQKMRKDWNQMGCLQHYQPFNRPPFNYPGNEEIITDNGDIVDWVLIELRDRANQIVGRLAALVTDNGSVINTEGEHDFLIDTYSEDSLFNVAVRHVNHLGIRTKNLINFSRYKEPVVVNTTFAAEYLFSNQPYSSTIRIGPNFLMRAGDANGNGVIKNNGPGNDDLVIRLALFPWPGLYSLADINMDGWIDYRDLEVLNYSILGGTLSNIYREQL